VSGWSVALVVLALALLAFAGVSFLAHQRILVAHSLAAAEQMGELALDLGPGRAVVGGQVGVGLAGAGSGQLVLVGGDGDSAASRCAGAPGRRLRWSSS
jgi:hypothetical protein